MNKKVHRVCRRCGKMWNVSSKDPGEKVYICPTCEHKTRLADRTKNTRKE